MTISDRISRDELVQMYEFAVNQLTTAQEENKQLVEIIKEIKLLSQKSSLLGFVEMCESALNGGKNDKEIQRG